MKGEDSKSIKDIFNGLAPSYDQLNDIFSLGMHRIWKKQLITFLSPMRGESWLDLCCGTGDLAFSLANYIGPKGNVVAIDSAPETLTIAKRRAKKSISSSISWKCLDALDTGLQPHSFDGAVMAYGLRNLIDTFTGLKELHRLLKPGGKAGILDFNSCEKSSKSAKFQTFYLSNIVIPIASRFGYGEHFNYLKESIQSFPNGNIQKILALDAGFTEASHKIIAAGQMGVLILKA